MKKNFFVVLSILSISTFAYGESAIIQSASTRSSIVVPSYNRSMMKQVQNSFPTGSSIINSSLNAGSNIQTSSQNVNSVSNFKKFLEDKSNPYYAIEAFKDGMAAGKFRQAANILVEYYISSNGAGGSLGSENTRYLNSIGSSLQGNIANSTTNPDLYALMGSILLIEQDKSGAVNYILKAKELNPSKYSTLLGKIYYINGERDKAYDILSEQVQKYPSDYEALYYKTLLLANKGNIKEIQKNCQQLLNANKYTTEASAILFRILDSENASNEKIINSLLPKNRGIAIDKGYDILIPKMIKRNQTAVAEKMILNSEQYNPDNVNLYLTAAEAYAEKGDTGNARNYLEKSKRLLDSPEDISRYNLVAATFSGEQLKGARDLALSGKYDDAIKVYEKSKNPDSVETLLGLADSYAGMGDNTKALGYLNKAMTMYPENADVYYSFAKYFANNNDIETARKYINNAQRLNPKSPKIEQLSNKLRGKKLEDLFDEAFSAFDTQNYEETISILNKIIKIEPNNYTAYYYKGLTYGNMNNYGAAINEFMRAKKLNPQFVFVDYLLAIAYDNLGEIHEAKKYYNAYLSNEHNVTNENAEYINYAKARVQKL